VNLHFGGELFDFIQDLMLYLSAVSPFVGSPGWLG